RTGGVLAVHAPFGEDPVRPMHVVHSDVVSPRMRSIGFQPVECEFPDFLWPPKMWEKRAVNAVDRAAYYVYDNYLNNAVGARLASVYRSTVRRRIARATDDCATAGDIDQTQRCSNG